MFSRPVCNAAMTPSTSSTVHNSPVIPPQIQYHIAVRGRRLRRAVSNGTRCTAFFKFKNPLRGSSEDAGVLSAGCAPICLCTVQPLSMGCPEMHLHAQAFTGHNPGRTTARMTSNTTSITWACWQLRCKPLALPALLPLLESITVCTLDEGVPLCAGHLRSAERDAQTCVHPTSETAACNPVMHAPAYSTIRGGCMNTCACKPEYCCLLCKQRAWLQWTCCC